MNILIIIILAVIFSLLNRVRGGGLGYLSADCDRYAKWTSGSLIAGLIYLASGSAWALLGIPLYILGESFGWGKWIGALVLDRPFYKQEEGHTYVDFSVFNRHIKFDFWDGIHHLANLLIPERKNWQGYSVVALGIRGCYWWAPIWMLAVATGCIGLHYAIGVVLALGVVFPASVLTAMQLNFKIPCLMKLRLSKPELSWERAEFIYGACHGVALAMIFWG